MSGQSSGGVVSANTSAGLDVLSNGNGSGNVAQRLLASNFDVNSLRPCGQASASDPGLVVNGTLLEEEWRFFDNQVQDIARENLPVVTDLVSRGLTYALPGAMGVMDLQWEELMNDLGDASVTMSGLPGADRDQETYGIRNMPIPIYHKEFFFNLRHLAAARRNGRQPDASHAQVATRKVAESIEGSIFNGLNVGGTPIYGFRTHPQRKTANVTRSFLTATGEEIVSDVIRFIDILTQAPNYFNGPFTLYVSWSVGTLFANDYKADSDKTIMQRIMEIPGIQDVQISHRLQGSEMIMVQTTSDVVQIIDGLQPTMVDWESHGGFQQHFKIFAIMPPRIRATGLNQSGILHIT